MPAPGDRATLDFFAAQAVARRRTALLVVSFSVAVLAVTAIVYLAVLLLAGHWTLPAAPRSSGFLLRPDLLVPTIVGVWGVVGAGSIFHAVRLSSGGEAVAAMLGGERVRDPAADAGERRLLNVVEEMALAAATPVPKVFVLRGEGSINAFAAGFAPDRAVIAVTRGAVDRLSRDELQGVVAHELSHVLNADTRIDLRLLSAVGGLSAVAFVGRLLLENTGRSSRRGGGGIVLFGLALVIAGAVGTFFGNLVRFAVARQREWLADASAVQFTRNPEGLAGALRKIAVEGSALVTPRAAEAAHLFFAAGVSGFVESLFSTHPPIEERIRRLAPHAPAAGAPSPAAGIARPPIAAGAVGLAAPVPTGAVPVAARLDAATRILEELPGAVRAAAADPFAARAVVAALLLDPSAPARARQVDGLRRLDAALAAEVVRWTPAVDAVAVERRLPLLELALPALGDLSPTQGRRLDEALAALARDDGVVTPFEQAVLRAARRRLDRQGAPLRPRLRQPDDAAMECLELLSAIAWVGGRDQAGAEDALRTGLRVLGLDSAWRLLPRDRTTRAGFDRALARLDLGSFELKGRILDACVASARADGTVTPREGQILRAIAAAFGIPSPHAVALG